MSAVIASDVCRLLQELDVATQKCKELRATKKDLLAKLQSAMEAENIESVELVDGTKCLLERKLVAKRRR